jgi:hypothetical protein
MKSSEERDIFSSFFSPGGAGFAAARSGQGRAVVQARRERTLDGEDRGECIVWGRKRPPHLMERNLYFWRGNYDE